MAILQCDRSNIRRWIGLTFFIFLYGLTTLSGITATTAQDGASRRLASEKSLGSVDLTTYDPKKPTFWISPDGRHVAWLVEKGIAIDGQVQTYEYGIKEGTFSFSPDSQRTGYVANATGLKGGGSEVLVIDGKQQTTGYSSIRPGPVFSPDSKHVASIARLRASSFDQTLLIDGRESEERHENYNWELTFTPDSKRVVYAVEIDDKYRMREDSVDGSEPRIERMHGPAILIGNFFHGPQGQVGYIASADEKQFVVYNGKDDGHRFEEIDARSIVISDDGKHIAYVGEPSGFADAAVIGGKLGKTYDGFEDIIKGSLGLSPDGSRGGYAVKSSGKHYVFVDGRPGKMYANVSGPFFSPDSKHVSYHAVNGNKLLLVVNGKEGSSYDDLGVPVFSPDGKSLACWVELGGRQWMVVSGQKHKAYDSVGTPHFSPDSQRLAYLAEAGGKRLLVENGKAGKPYDDLDGNLYFSPDSRHLAAVLGEDGKQFVVVNGSEGPRYDKIVTIAGGKIHFGPEGLLHYMATKGNEIFLVEETLQ